MRWWTLGLLALLVVVNAGRPALSSDWVEQGARDQLTDKRSPGVAVGAVIEERDRRRTGQFWVYCADNSTTMTLQADNTYFGSGSVPVRYTLDGGAPLSAVWDGCRGGRCVGLWNGQGIPFLKSLFDKRELRVVLDRRFSESLLATMNVEGARGALSSVGEACGWMPKEGKK